jgi:hypothetical protein
LQHPVHFPGEQAYGRQLSTEKSVRADAVRLYKELSEVERAFANLKDVIETRLLYHGSGHPPRNRKEAQCGRPR